jgi:DNA polymerase III subunit delta
VTMPIHLLWGEDAFLLREAAIGILGDRHPREVAAGEWEGGELHDLATPSLFGEPRSLLVTDARALTKDAAAELAAYLRSPDPDAIVIICVQTAERGRPPAGLVKLIESVGQVQHVQVARKDLEAWLVRRSQAMDVDLAPQAARALVESIGEETGSLAAAVEQLTGAFPGQKLTSEHVHGQFRGLGEQRTWDLCDRAFGKDLPAAIRSLRAIEVGGDDALKVLGGISSRLRDLIRVRSLPDRMPPAEAARQAGLRFDWQARRYQQQARRFTMEQLVELHEQIADADRALKSGATGDVIMPSLIAAIAGTP